MQKPFSKSAMGFMLIVAIITWLALALQLYILIKNSSTNGLTPWVATWNFFSYFTVLTNLLVALALSFVLSTPASQPGRFFSKSTTMSAIAVYILIVGIVYNTILRFIWQPTGLQKWVDETLHLVVPALFVLFWILYVPKGKLQWTHPFRWLIYPVVYLLYALLRGEYSGFHAYPFINSENLGYSRVLLNAAGMMLVFIATGLLFVVVDRKMVNT